MDCPWRCCSTWRRHASEERQTGWGARTASLSAPRLLLIAGAAGAAGWFLAVAFLEAPGLSTGAQANRIVIALYTSMLVIAGAAALARRDLGLTLFPAALLALGFLVLAIRCQHVFDGLRMADYALLGGLAALFAPGLRARWVGWPVLVAIGVAAMLAGGLRLGHGYDRLFAHTTGEVEAARWIKVASDTKMSLLLLGEGDRSGTFEGSSWLFDGSPVVDFVAALNQGPQFQHRHISYVLLTDYMQTRGAEVNWFSSTIKPTSALLSQLDDAGARVYSDGGVTIWGLEPMRLAAAKGIIASYEDRPATSFLSRLSGILSGRTCR